MSDETKMYSAVAYVTLLGAIVAYLVKKEDMTVKFHVMQSVLFWVSGIVIIMVLGTLVPVFGFGGLAAIAGILVLLTGLVQLVLVLGMIYLAVRAYQGDKVMLPVLGEQAAKMAK